MDKKLFVTACSVFAVSEKGTFWVAYYDKERETPVIEALPLSGIPMVDEIFTKDGVISFGGCSRNSLLGLARNVLVSVMGRMDLVKSNSSIHATVGFDEYSVDLDIEYHPEEESYFDCLAGEEYVKVPKRKIDVIKEFASDEKYGSSVLNSVFSEGDPSVVSITLYKDFEEGYNCEDESF